MSSDFWARRLGATTPATAAPRPPAPATGTPWWQAPVYDTARVPTHPAQQPPGPLDVNPLTAIPVRPHLAPSTLQTETCPNCGSGNFGKVSHQYAARCFDCGHGLDRNQHSTAGMSGIVGVRQGVAPRRALAQTGGEFRPDIIVGHGM